MEACVLKVTRETSGSHTVYRLRADSFDEVLGEAVISEGSGDIRLHGIFVKSEHRGKGYGTTLMEAVLSLGEARVITLCTGLGNVPFFRRFGFEVTDIGDSLVSMEKRL